MIDWRFDGEGPLSRLLFTAVLWVAALGGFWVWVHWFAE